MRVKKILSALLLTVLTTVLIMLVGSRNADKTIWMSSLSGSIDSAGYAQSGGPALDNDVTNIAKTEVTPKPDLTPEPTNSKPDINISSWEYVLVNKDNSIGSYAPDVVAIESTAQYFDSRAIEALERFLHGAREAGFAPYINAAYRPYSAQEYIFNGKASQIAWGGTYTYEEAVEKAKSIVAFPGTSEHQTGLCVDITDKYYSVMDADQIDPGLLKWLKDHCAEYGFILRYPADKESITGWNEPWHYRYVGVEAAEYITDNHLCLEEFRKLY